MTHPSQQRSHGGGGASGGGSSGDGDIGTMPMQSAAPSPLMPAQQPVAPQVDSQQQHHQRGASATSKAQPRASQPATMRLSQRECAGLQRWLLAFGCVTFDLDHGPELEFLAPALQLTDQEKDNIAFSSFPDTAIFDAGQAVFSFRMRSGDAPPTSQHRTGNSAPTLNSQPLRKDSKRSSALTSKRRSLFGASSSSAQSTEQSPLPSATQHLPIPTSQSMGRTRSAAHAPVSSLAVQGSTIAGTRASPKLSGASSHGAMHQRFKMADSKRGMDGDGYAGKDKDKETGKSSPFRGFVNLWNRSSNQRVSSHTASASDPADTGSPSASPDAHMPGASFSPSVTSRPQDAKIGESFPPSTSATPPEEGSAVAAIAPSPRNAAAALGLLRVADPADYESPPPSPGLADNTSAFPSPADRTQDSRPTSPTSTLASASAFTPSTTFAALAPSPARSPLSGPSPASADHGKGTHRGEVVHAEPAIPQEPFVYGYVFFQQRPDSSIRRGYFQKSFVILSHLPLLGLWTRVVEGVGQALLSAERKKAQATGVISTMTSDVLRKFVKDVCQWPMPDFHCQLTLDLLGRSLSFDITRTDLGAQAGICSPSTVLGQTNGSASQMTPFHPESPRATIAEVFRGDLLSDLWLLWECLLIGDPILVLGPEPCAASSAVWHLRSLISPLRLGPDWRPFMNLNDRDFAQITAASSQKESGSTTSSSPQVLSLVGVSNPFFAQSPACADWTAVRVESCTDAKIERPSTEAVRVVRSDASASSSAHQSDLSTSASGAGHAQPNKGGLCGGAAQAQYIPGVESKRKRRIHKDRALLKQAFEVCKEGRYTEASVLIRTHFDALTRNFLAPLDGYFAKLAADEMTGSKAQSGDSSRHFDTTAFLAHLKAVGTSIPLKSRGMHLSSLGGGAISSAGLHLPGHNHGSAPATASSNSHHGLHLPTSTRTSLYLDFIHGPNFAGWWAAKWREVEWEQSANRLEDSVQAIESILDATSDVKELRAVKLLEDVATAEFALARAAAPYTFSKFDTTSSKWVDAAMEDAVPVSSPSESARQSVGAADLETRNDLGISMMRADSKMSSHGGESQDLKMIPDLGAPSLHSAPSQKEPDQLSSAILALALSCSDRSRSILKRYVTILQRAQSVALAAVPAPQ